jgi:ElaB/YqjD/DUF883 family membrane-anchored ribosome-binding protein
MNPSPTTPTQTPPLSYTPAGQGMPTLGSSSPSTGISQGPQNPGTAAGGALQQLPQRAREVAEHTREVMQERYQQVRAGAEQGLAAGQTYVREHPLPTVLGALALGTLIGFAIGISRREETFSERLSDHPLQAIREAVIAALAPAADRIHDSYDSARDSASKALNRAGRSTDSWLHSLSRAGSNLKFW